MDMLEAWLSGREAMMPTELGDSIQVVEELIRRHDDFEKTVYAQEDKFNAIKRRTKVGSHIIHV
jgi:spectrin beta